MTGAKVAALQRNNHRRRRLVGPMGGATGRCFGLASVPEWTAPSSAGFVRDSFLILRRWIPFPAPEAGLLALSRRSALIPSNTFHRVSNGDRWFCS